MVVVILLWFCGGYALPFGLRVDKWLSVAISPVAGQVVRLRAFNRPARCRGYGTEYSEIPAASDGAKRWWRECMGVSMWFDFGRARPALRDGVYPTVARKAFATGTRGTRSVRRLVILGRVARR